MSIRRSRAAEQIRRELTEILFERRDADLPSVYLDKVELAPDFSFARVLVQPADPSAQPKDDAELVRPLQKIEPALRGEIARRMQLRKVPHFVFTFDRGQRNARRIEELLDQAKKRSKWTGELIVLLLLGVAALRAADAPPKLERYEASATIMGSEFHLALYGKDLKLLGPVAYAAFDEARRVDDLISNYKPDSELSRLNDRAGAADVVVGDELFDLLARCFDYSRRSDGAFDPTVGKLMKIWGFYKGSGKLPGALALHNALEDVGYRRVTMNAVAHTIRFEVAGIEIDPGGFGKGYAVERVVTLLRKYKIPAAMVSAGSSSLYGLGAPPAEPRGWKALIRDPKDAAKTVATVFLKDQSLSTSGSYEKFFDVDGVTYSHIMDPRTGMPAKGTLAVSVVADSPFDSEVWTTALFVNGESWARKNAPQDLRILFCSEGRPCGWRSGEPAAAQ